MLEDGFYLVGEFGKAYTKFAARLTRLIKTPQNPIKADKLDFEADADTLIPEYAEIIYVVRGCHIFHGEITSRKNSTLTWKCSCESMQGALDNLFIPDFRYHAVDVASILASDEPTDGGVTIGALFWAQSIIPNGLWEAYSSTVAKLTGGGTKSALRSYDLFASTNFPNAGSIDACDGVEKLTAAANIGAISTDQYFRDVDDLYVRLGDGSYLNNAYLVAASYWLDNKIRLGNVEVHDYVPAIDVNLTGQASKALDKFFEQLGMEAQFLSRRDGTVRLNLGLPIARGSETDPVRTFTHDLDCTIEFKRKVEPDVQAAIGTDGENSPTICVTDWSRRSAPALFKILEGKGKTEEDVRAELIKTILNNQDSFKIDTAEIDYFLRVGDYVRVIRPETDKILRVRAIDINLSRMIVDVGKRPFNLSKEFGNLFVENEDANAQIVSAKEMSSVSGTFVVLATSVADKLWKCYYEVSFTNDVDDSPIALDAFMTIELNGAIIPPGRIKIDGNSLKIDISRYCLKSETVDTTNTLVPHFYNLEGWVAQTLEVKQKEGQSMSNGSDTYSPGDGDWLGCA